MTKRITLLICAMTLVACSAVSGTSGTAEPTQVLTNDNSLAETATAVAARIVSPTQAPTATDVPLSPVSTLPESERVQYVQAMIRNNGGCQLPCWWGDLIIPGLTSHDEANAEFVRLGIPLIDEPAGYLGSAFIVPPGPQAVFDYVVDLRIRGNGDAVWSIQMEGSIYNRNDPSQSPRFVQDWKEHYSWQHILSQYGAPDEYYLIIDPSDGPVFANFWLLLIYEKLGMSLAYGGTAQDTKPHTAIACPDFDKVTLIQLVLIPSKEGSKIADYALEDINKITSDLKSKHSSAALGVTPESFYETFKNPGGTHCFEETSPTQTP